MVASLPPQPQRKLQPIVPPKQPWYHVGMDLVTDLPTNSLGYKHIIVVVCYLSKFVTARPLFTKTTKSVLEALTDIYLTYGVPKIVQHDQGRVYKQSKSKYHRPFIFEGPGDRKSVYFPQPDQVALLSK